MIGLNTFGENFWTRPNGITRDSWLLDVQRGAKGKIVDGKSFVYFALLAAEMAGGKFLSCKKQLLFPGKNASGF